MTVSGHLRKLQERWGRAKSAERANFQPYLIELCEALEVERPGPAGSGYQFELPVKVITQDGVEATNFIDCHRAGFFAIEAKDDGPARPTDPLVSGKKTTAGKKKKTSIDPHELLLRRAFGQLRNYVSHAPGGLPPYLIVMDVARTAIVWDRWNGSYGDWQSGRRIDLTSLADNEVDTNFLRAVWTDPASLDPRARAQAVTTEVAGYLANLARSLEAAGYEQERVARFIIRCVFTMFAEDVGLLPDEPFRRLLERCVDDPDAFQEQAFSLWKAMDEGKRFDWKQIMRFNGHFFRDAEALPLNRQAILILALAAAADWQDVEPAIFGTLLTRALDPEERHRLGAEFTPRAFVERVVIPTVEEPLREQWQAVQAAVLQLSNAGKKKEAERRLREFHDWMKGLRFLDPACGSGNFLYVTMHMVKRIELEVLRELDEVTGKHEILFEEVHPRQFFGIEVKPWAREIAELVLWIGYHQFWRAHHTQRPQEPVLQDTGTIECRDAILDWDEIRRDPTRDRPDPTPRLTHHVTGHQVPDPAAVLHHMEYLKPRRAPWPRADFIIGNPPYIGNKRMRDALGDGYVEALRRVYSDIPDNVDYVMYWWARAAEAVAKGDTIRAGLITTNSITQIYHQPIVARAAEIGARVIWAAPDHPWVDEKDGAAVRVAMTVLAHDRGYAERVEVDDNARFLRESRVRALNADLTAHANVAASAQTRLTSNEGLSSRGFTLVGRGFVLTKQEADDLISRDARNAMVIRPYLNGKDIAGKKRGVYVIDFGLMEEDEVRRFPFAYEVLRDRVLPERAANARASYRDRWWRFGEPRTELRPALRGLGRYIATAYVSKQRFFVFLDENVAPDEKLVAIAANDTFVLGVLSSRVHIEWALASGGKLGVGNDPSYNNSRTFDSFPFPDPLPTLRSRIGDMAEAIEAHRNAGLARDPVVTMTGMYNAIDKLRAREPLEEKDAKIHALAACGALADMHDQLDAAVAEAYGWTWPLSKEAILERLVQLHAERQVEEKTGLVRWLRPDYQEPRYKNEAPPDDLGLPEIESAPKKQKKPAWPKDVISQIRSIKRLVASEALLPNEVVMRFAGAKQDIVQRHLDILTVMGEVRKNSDGRFQALR